ncbi:MAG: FhaA domain-containing protein [Mycobacteriales bacterium]
MGVLQRFERRLEGLVEGAFARVFGGVVQPVEVAAALQREAADKKQIVGHGRVLVPNSYTVELGPTDLERFAEWDAPLRAELASMVEEHAAAQGWSFVGDVRVHFERVESLDTGVFRVRSTVLATEAPAGPHTTGTGRPRLVQPATGGNPERVVPLSRPVTVVGRGADADLRLPDTGVSRAHAELRLDGDRVHVMDLQSTNGTLVNGRRVREAELHDGDRLDIGATALIYRSAG